MRNTGNGILRVLVLALLMVPLAATAATRLVGVEHVQSADGDVKLYLKTSGDTPEVSVFATESPARIVLDMADTESGVDAGKVPVGQGAVQQYSAVSAGGRTRLVVDLTQPVAYDYSAEASQVVLTLAGGSQGAAAAATPMAGGPAVTGIDFRLGESGQAKVIVNTNRAGASMSVQEKPDGLTVDLFGASLPESLDQRLDVTDFATPVQFIDSFGVASGVRLELKTYGLYEHMTYESGNEFVIEVSQMSQAVQAAEEEVVKFFEEKTYEGTRVTFNFQDIPVRSVLQLIADVSDLNIVVADSVGGNLTLRLTNVPWDQALDIVMDARNLDMRKNGNVLWIAPTAEIAAREQQLLQAQLDRRILEPLHRLLIRCAGGSEVLLCIVLLGQSHLVRQFEDLIGNDVELAPDLCPGLLQPGYPYLLRLLARPPRQEEHEGDDAGDDHQEHEETEHPNVHIGNRRALAL